MLQRQATIKCILNQKPRGIRRRELIHWSSLLPGFDHRELPEAAADVRDVLDTMTSRGLLVEHADGCVHGRQQMRPKGGSFRVGGEPCGV